jgi:hypothetical protein
MVIPKEVRECWHKKRWQSLVLRAIRPGNCHQQQELLAQIAEAIFAGKGAEVLPKEGPCRLQVLRGRA